MKTTQAKIKRESWEKRIQAANVQMAEWENPRAQSEVESFQKNKMLLKRERRLNKETKKSAA